MNPSISLLLLTVLYSFSLGVSLYRTDLEPYRLWVLGTGLVLSVVVYYWQFYTPLMKLRRKYTKQLVCYLLNGLREKYESEVGRSFNLRCNVMYVRRRRMPPWKRYLRIDCYVGDYSDAEREQEYDDNVGTSATALHTNDIVYFDAQEKQESRKGMTGTQLAVTEHIKSILSVPVYGANDDDKTKPIAILSLDSENLLETSEFGKTEHYVLVMEHAAP